MRNTRWTMWVLVILGAAAAANAQDKWMVLANPDNTFAFSIMRGEEMVGNVGFVGWGPSWKWVGINPKTGPKGDEYIVRHAIRHRPGRRAGSEHPVARSAEE